MAFSVEEISALDYHNRECYRHIAYADDALSMIAQSLADPNGLLSENQQELQTSQKVIERERAEWLGRVAILPGIVHNI